MPGWHKATKELAAKKEIAVLGITQEQHPNRCRLFSQWQQFDWPILHDPVNLIENKAVPIAILIDEHGVVRAMPRSTRDLDKFLKTQFSAPDATAKKIPKRPATTDLETLRAKATSEKTAQAWSNLGDGIVLWSKSDEIDSTIQAYQRAVDLDDKNGRSHFRLGVAFRMRYDSPKRQPKDFEMAVRHWDKALEIDPSQYIWRRRIQQYGPRLDKPYPFYDWVEKAQTEVAGRGEKPVQLQVELSGAEVARFSRKFASEASKKHPDPDSKIPLDKENLVEIRSVKVRHTSAKVNAARIHIELKPNDTTHWNNESEPLKIWIEPVDGWELETNMVQSSNPPQPETKETRNIEFEIRQKSESSAGKTLRGFALYYVCEETGGKCLFLRRNFEIKLDQD